MTTAILLAVVVLLAVDDVVQRLAIRTFKRERAAEAVKRLTGLTVVDGHELPNVDDERWSMITRKFDPDPNNVKQLAQGYREDEVLAIGPVLIRLGTHIYVGNGSPIKATSATNKYAAEVSRHYKNRIARKAVES